MPEAKPPSTPAVSVEMRRAVPDDVPAIAKVVNDWIDGTDWMPRTDTAEVIEGYIRDAFDKREMWVVGTPVCGYASVDPQKDYLGALYTATPGLGVGKALLDHVRENRDFLWLTTHVPNISAQRFYVREGFKVTGEEASDTPGDPIRVYRMEWRR